MPILLYSACVSHAVNEKAISFNYIFRFRKIYSCLGCNTPSEPRSRWNLAWTSRPTWSGSSKTISQISPKSVQRVNYIPAVAAAGNPAGEKTTLPSKFHLSPVLVCIRNKQIRTREGNMFADTRPWDTVDCKFQICIVHFVSESERRCTGVGRNLCSTGVWHHVNLQLYWVIIISYWVIRSRRPRFWLPCDWCRYCSARPCSQRRPPVVRHDARERHGLISQERLSAGRLARWSGIWNH